MTIQYDFEQDFNNYDETIRLSIKLQHDISDKDKDAIRDIMDTLIGITNNYLNIRAISRTEGGSDDR